jgi:lysophospholipase L1-like esterase
MKKWLPVAAIAAFVAILGWRAFGPSGKPTHALINFDSPDGKKVVAFGDSLTAGYGATAGTGSYPAQLAALMGLEIVNLGKDGETTSSAKARLAEVKAQNPDFVLVTLGGNDLRQRMDLAETISNLESIFRELQDMGAGVVYLSVNPPLVGDNWSMAIEGVARASGVLWVDDVMKDLWGNAELMSDAVHPNDKGYGLIAGRVHEALRQTVDFGGM